MTKTEVIRVCVSPEEKETLEKAAERAGLKFSVWARLLMMSEVRKASKKECL